MKKTLVYLMMLCALLTLVSCAKENPVTKEETKTAETKTAESVTQGDKPVEEDVAADCETAYAALTSDFQKLVEFRFSDEFTDTWYDHIKSVGFSEIFNGLLDSYASEEHDDPISNMIDKLPNSFSEQGTEDFGVIRYDLNEDRIPELFWAHKDHTIVAVFTYQNGAVTLLDTFRPGYQGYVSQQGVLYGWGTVGASDLRCSVYELTDDGTVEMILGFSSGMDILGDPTKTICYEYKGNAKTKITQSRFEELAKQYPREHGKFWLETAILPLN